MNSVQVAFAFSNKFNNEYIFLKFILHSTNWDYFQQHLAKVNLTKINQAKRATSIREMVRKLPILDS